MKSLLRCLTYLFYDTSTSLPLKVKNIQEKKGMKLEHKQKSGDFLGTFLRNTKG